MSIALRTCLLLFALYGYLQHFSKKIKPELALGVVFCAIGSIVFIAGTINIVPCSILYCSWAIVAAGLFLAAVSLKDLKGSISRIVTPGTIFFALLCAVLLFVLKGSIFTYQDNYTHWAAASRILLREDRFSLPTDTNVWFPSYPLGSSSFIYFICKICGADSEWAQMFSQALLMAGTTVSVFAFAKNLKGYLLAAATVVMMLCCNIELTELLVDTLLPAVAVGGMAICIYYRHQLAEKFVYTVPYMILLTAIKNSGIFFVAVIIVAAFAYIQKTKVNLAKWTLCSIAPFAALYLWQLHVKTTFTDGLTTKHSMSFENFSQVFGEKTADDVKNIISLFADAVFSFSNPFVYIIIFITAVFIWQFAVKKEMDKALLNSCTVTICAYIAYQLGNLGMYLFTMPLVEALDLACYDRYHDSILIFICAVLCMGVLESKVFSNKDSKSSAAVCGVLCAVMLYFSLTPSFSFYKPQQLSASHDRIKLMALMEEYDIPVRAGYVIILDDDYGLQMSFRHMARFTLDSEDVKARYLSDLKESEHLLNEYEYLIIFHQSDAVMDYVTEKFGEDVPQVINLFEYRH